MKKRPVFLSASVPDRGPYSDSVDPIAIREAILALVSVTVRDRDLVFGGHPAISPLIEHAARSLGAVRNVHIYQSRFFEREIPAVAKEFENFHWTPREADREKSLTALRQEMIRSRAFCACVVIGGMDGIFEEVNLFKDIHPGSVILPVGSTGGAATEVLENRFEMLGSEDQFLLGQENRYRRVFSTLIPNV